MRFVVVAVAVLLPSIALADPATKDPDPPRPDAIGFANIEFAAQVAHGSFTRTVEDSYTAMNFLVRVQAGLLELMIAADRNAGHMRIGDYEGFAYGIGGANRDAVVSKFDMMYEVSGGLRLIVPINHDVELLARGGIYFNGDIARETPRGAITYVAWQLGAGVRYQKVYVEAGPDLMWSSGGTGVQALAYYRFDQDAHYFSDVGLRLEHVGGDKEQSNGQPYSETIVNFFVGTH